MIFSMFFPISYSCPIAVWGAWLKIDQFYRSQGFSKNETFAFKNPSLLKEPYSYLVQHLTDPYILIALKLYLQKQALRDFPHSKFAIFAAALNKNGLDNRFALNPTILKVPNLKSCLHPQQRSLSTNINKSLNISYRVTQIKNFYFKWLYL